MNDLLSVVVPAYEEAERIQAGILEQVVSSLQARCQAWELIVVDDGSRDATPDLVEQLVQRNDRVRLLREHHCGKGFAVLAGMRAAVGSRILFMDLDQATPVDEVEGLLPWLQRGYDIVIGTRGIRRRGASPARKGISLGYILLRRMLLGPLFTVDTQCGFKLFSRSSLEEITGRLRLYRYENRVVVRGHRVTPGFDTELLLVARQLGYGVRPVPVSWSCRRCRGMKLSASSIQGLTDLWRIGVALRRGSYDISG